MLTGLKTAFRPSLERFEARIVAAGGGVVSAAAHHAAPHHHPAHVASHHASHPPKPEGHLAAPSAPANLSSTAPSQPTSTPSPSLPKDTTTDQAWVELVNMTGQALEYQIKLGPYANGQFLTFDIGPGATQYRFSSLISNGQRVKADFAIQFGNGPVIPLNTGISQSWARGYYIFFDSNFQPYVAPFINSWTG